ncbi:MAG: amino acid ABC transporter substrate-binding protein [Alphaproteobacteria bacterium]|nr:amino acid ABC transporter substrate-binding protein [Alphaproteobacteria bacterium]
MNPKSLVTIILGLMLAGGGCGTARAGATFDAIKARGTVVCGVHTGSPGFSAPDAQGVWRGLDVDLCRGIAAAMFGDANKTRYVPTTSQQRFTALQSGEVDVLTRNTTLTLTRDTALGLNFAGVNFYDGQAFIVKTRLGVKSAKELGGATVCVQQGTTGELNLADYFRSLRVSVQPVVLERIEDGIAAFVAGRCDAFTADGSQLAAIRVSAIPNPDDAVVLPERISKEPLGPVVRHGDDQWNDIVRWVLLAMIEAEELGISQSNVDEMLKSPNPAIQRFLGVVPGFGKALGVDERWAYEVIKQVGNYGDSFDRHLGKSSPVKLERGLNDLWTRGGLMYALPLR